MFLMAIKESIQQLYCISVSLYLSIFTTTVSQVGDKRMRSADPMKIASLACFHN